MINDRSRQDIVNDAIQLKPTLPTGHHSEKHVEGVATFSPKNVAPETNPPGRSKLCASDVVIA